MKVSHVIDIEMQTLVFCQGSERSVTEVCRVFFFSMLIEFKRSIFKKDLSEMVFHLGQVIIKYMLTFPIQSLSGRFTGRYLKAAARKINICIAEHPL